MKRRNFLTVAATGIASCCLPEVLFGEKIVEKTFTLDIGTSLINAKMFCRRRGDIVRLVFPDYRPDIEAIKIKVDTFEMYCPHLDFWAKYTYPFLSEQERVEVSQRLGKNHPIYKQVYAITIRCSGTASRMENVESELMRLSRNGVRFFKDCIEWRASYSVEYLRVGYNPKNRCFCVQVT